MATTRELPRGTPGRESVRHVARRAAELRCPECGGDRLYARPFVMRDACRSCGLVYEPEQGFFVGAIYVNYAATAVAGLGAALLADWLRPMSLAGQLAIALPLMLSVPVLFFHHSRSIWLAMNVCAGGGQRSAAGRR